MSVGGTGIKDWLVQRFTAVVLTFYSFFLLFYLLSHKNLSYADWQLLFANPWMLIATFVTIICMVFHAWIGMWTILTDYVKYSFLRQVLLAIFMLALLSYVVWGYLILWGN